MRNFFSAAAALMLLSACNPNADTDNPPVATNESAQERQADAPSPGANSFTQDQARGRLVEAGFTDPIALSQAEDGTWRGTAQQGGRTMNVSLDYQGNITTGSPGDTATNANTPTQ